MTFSADLQISPLLWAEELYIAEAGHYILDTVFGTVFICLFFFVCLKLLTTKISERQVENIYFPCHWRKADPVLCHNTIIKSYIEIIQF